MDGETQNEQDARVERLWRTMNGGENVEQLDLAGLKRGLARIDHPLQNADGLLQALMRQTDVNHDGRIHYEEFRIFVEHAERELWKMFKSIDRDHSGEIDRDELQQAFREAKLSMSPARLADFFDHIDINHDGKISFEEWRNFLLFVPAQSPNLRAILSYYSSTVIANPEGDVLVTEDTKRGIGIGYLLHIVLDMLLLLLFALNNPKPWVAVYHTTPLHVPFSFYEVLEITSSKAQTFPWDPGERFLLSRLAMDEHDGPAALQDQGDKSEKLTPVPLGYFIAGGIAGIVSRTATAPLDRLKTYLIAQTSTKKEAVDALASGQAARAAKHATRPIFDALAALWRMGGIRSLFAGNGLNVLKVMPESAIKFGSYEGTKKFIANLEGHDDPRALSNVGQFFSAGFAGVIAQFAVYPIDTLKFRMQCETTEGGLQGNKLIADTARKMYRQGGARAYYRGLTMGLGGMFPYSAIDLTTYEWLKRTAVRSNARKLNMDEDDPEALPGKMMTGAIGALSSSFGASVVYPFNLLRTRLQSQGTVIHPPTYDGWRDCFKKTVRKEGYRGLFRGLSPNLLKVVPSMSISYMSYEYAKKAMNLD